MLLTAIFRKTAANQAFCKCGLIIQILQVVGMKASEAKDVNGEEQR